VRAETERWLTMAEEDWEVSRLVLAAGHRSAFVFHAHLCLEKTLKAIVMEESGSRLPPYIHNLVQLAALTGLTIDDNVMASLAKISPHGVDARYDNDLRGYTEEFCNDVLKGARESRQWLRHLLT
jgi:HEPN domain-containing protein